MQDPQYQVVMAVTVVLVDYIVLVVVVAGQDIIFHILT